MRLFKKFSAAVVLTTAAFSSVGSQYSKEVEDEADRILSTLTLEQKVAQMIQPEIRNVSANEVRKYGLGGVLNGGGSFPNNDKNATVQDWIELADEFYEASRKADNGGIPIIWGTDAVHGHNNVFGATYFPHNIGLGAARNPQLIEDIARATAREVKATGIDWIFAPTVAIAKDYRWGRTYESYADDSKLVYEYSKRAVTGMQSEGIIATAKHFIGDGATLRGKDQGDVRLPLDTLLEEHGSGYVGALEENVHSVMASFNSWYGEKVHGSKELMTDVLKQKMGFNGFIVSDWNGIGQIKGCNNADCAQAVNAGIDMIMVPQDWKALMGNIIAQVKSGEIPQSRIDDAVTRILRVKIAMGLFEQKKPSARIDKALLNSVGSAEHRSIARQAVRESLVLLKNNQQILPLNRPQNVLVTGSAADDIGQQNGGWTLTWQGTNNENSDFPNATSIADGLTQQLGDIGSKVELTKDGSYTTKPDVAIVVFGELPYAEGQGDIQTLAFESKGQDDVAIIKSLSEQGIPVVSVFVTGRPMWINDVINASTAVVVAWLPGTEGAGVADVMVSKDNQYDFTGTLPFAWPAMDINPLNENAPVAEHLFPIGYGLSLKDEVTIKNDLDEAPKKQISKTDRVIFRRGSQPPFQAHLGDESNWLKPVTGAEATSGLGFLSMTSFDVQVQEDARRIEFSGDGSKPSQFFWKTDSDAGVDLTSIANADGALSLVMQVNEAPTGKVELRMDCIWPCRGSIDVTNLMKKVPKDTWLNLSIPLKCFKNVGADLTKINAPAVFVTNKSFTFSVLDVSLTTKPNPSSVMKCP